MDLGVIQHQSAGPVDQGLAVVHAQLTLLEVRHANGHAQLALSGQAIALAFSRTNVNLVLPLHLPNGKPGNVSQLLESAPVGKPFSITRSRGTQVDAFVGNLSVPVSSF